MRELTVPTADAPEVASAKAATADATAAAPPDANAPPPVPKKAPRADRAVPAQAAPPPAPGAPPPLPSRGASGGGVNGAAAPDTRTHCVLFVVQVLFFFGFAS